MIQKIRHFILTGDVNSGKTSSLSEWCLNRRDVSGFLCPYYDGLRMLKTLPVGTMYPLEIDSKIDPSTIFHENIIQVGKFSFYESAFRKMRQLISEFTASKSNWKIIDEIGKLELNDKGLEPILGKYLSAFHQHDDSKNILVIRNYLLDQALKKYDLKDSYVVDKHFFNILNSTVVVILAGGESKRMGTDKAQLNYIGSNPQYLLLYRFFSSLFDKVFISIRDSSFDNNYQDVPKIYDTSDEGGPAAGFAAAINEAEDKNLLLVACDYPLLQDLDIFQLINEVDDVYDAFTFYNKEGFKIPVLGYYKNRCFKEFKTFLTNGGNSLHRFLDQVQTKVIKPNNYDNFESFDTSEQYAKWKYGSN